MYKFIVDEQGEIVRLIDYKNRKDYSAAKVKEEIGSLTDQLKSQEDVLNMISQAKEYFKFLIN